MAIAGTPFILSPALRRRPLGDFVGAVLLLSSAAAGLRPLSHLSPPGFMLTPSGEPAPPARLVFVRVTKKKKKKKLRLHQEPRPGAVPAKTPSSCARLPSWSYGFQNLCLLLFGRDPVSAFLWDANPPPKGLDSRTFLFRPCRDLVPLPTRPSVPPERLPKHAAIHPLRRRRSRSLLPRLKYPSHLKRGRCGQAIAKNRLRLRDNFRNCPSWLCPKKPALPCHPIILFHSLSSIHS